MGDEDALKGWKIQIDFSVVNNLSKAPRSCPKKSVGEMGWPKRGLKPTVPGRIY